MQTNPAAIRMTPTAKIHPHPRTPQARDVYKRQELMGRELRVERNALDVLADPTRYEAGQEVGLKFLNVKFYEEEAKA